MMTMLAAAFVPDNGGAKIRFKIEIDCLFVSSIQEHSRSRRIQLELASKLAPLHCGRHFLKQDAESDAGKGVAG